MSRRGLFIAVLFVLSASGVVWGASDPLLQRAFDRLLGNPKELRVDAIPYPQRQGEYARVYLYARGARIGGLLVDELWIRLVNLTVDVPALTGGTLKVKDYLDSAIYARISVRSLEQFFLAANSFKDIRLWIEGGSIHGMGTVLFQGVPAKIRLSGFFAANGEPEVWFYVESLHLNMLPVLSPVIYQLERQINPILNLRSWPIVFKIRSVKVTREEIIIATQADLSKPCLICGGGEPPALSP
ncbi:MAG: hypothetical protein QN189_02695 [Armatimonadota bacterium]|nr:hypothetical protein [Armatimonadota bacterium]